MIADWDTNCVVVTECLTRRFPELAAGLAKILAVDGIGLQTIPGARDVWIRDFAPVQVANQRFVQFRYEPDYLRGYDELKTGSEVFDAIGGPDSRISSDLVLDGGNIVSDGRTAILTEKVFRENRSRPRDAVRATLKDLLGVERIVTIPCEPGDVIGHADGMLRFVSPGHVVLADFSQIAADFGERIKRQLERCGLAVELLPYGVPFALRSGDCVVSTS